MLDVWMQSLLQHEDPREQADPKSHNNHVEDVERGTTPTCGGEGQTQAATMKASHEL